ncbi:MAG: hypothetical protein WBB93_19015, partial [Saprospiraceae bacterium]
YMSNGLTLLKQNKQHEFMTTNHHVRVPEARGIRSITIGKKPYVIIANNNGPMQLLAIKSN